MTGRTLRRTQHRTWSAVAPFGGVVTTAWWRSFAFLLCIASMALPVEGSSQILSPGRLSEPHADLEGIRSCTTCHQLGKAGISSERCLSCHTPLGDALDRAEGLHATFEEPDCGTCHKEHLGREFDMRRFDESSFDHDLEAFGLLGGHQDVECRDCHTDQYVTDVGVRSFKQEHEALDRTFLGLETTCAVCHAEDGHHGTQFTAGNSRFTTGACADCHDVERWEEAVLFDHEASDYPLEGEHRNVDCAACHESSRDIVRYIPTSFAGCQTCHSDPHESQLEGDCASCHSVDGWHVLSEGVVERTLDHDRTGFALEGAHAQLDCESCHAPNPLRSATVQMTYEPATRRFAYPHPESEECTSCHLDAHGGQLLDGPTEGECSSCHDQDAWQPTTYGLARHADGSEYELTGAHEVAPCIACHVNEGPDPETRIFRFADTECLACHTEDDPHELQFAEVQCSECHVTDDFLIESFDHDDTEFLLDGLHVDAECAACHLSENSQDAESFIRYRPVDTECVDCHTAEELI